MSVGKGSIERAAKAKDAAERKEAPAEAAVEEKKEAVKVTAKETAPKKKAVGKRPEKKKETVVAASVVSPDDIHEKKFEAVSHIYCELPTYLL